MGGGSGSGWGVRVDVNNELKFLGFFWGGVRGSVGGGVGGGVRVDVNEELKFL